METCPEGSDEPAAPVLPFQSSVVEALEGEAGTEMNPGQSVSECL